MSDVAVDVAWVEGLRFEALAGSGEPVVMDGGGGAGASPMESLLMAVASCMGIDVVDILTKMRVPFDALSVRAEGDRRAEPPRRYTAIRLIYRTEGVPAEAKDKLQRAIDLSRDTYCSVLHTLQPDIELSISIEAG